MDGIPTDDARVDDALKKTRRILRFLKAKNTNIWASGRVGLIGRKWRARRAIKKRGWSAIYSEAEKLYRQFPVETNKYIGALSFTGKDLVYPKDIYDKTLWLDFEDIQVPVPAGWDTYLTIQYGEDYMIPLMDPTVHGELIIDAHRDYRDVLPEVQKAYSTSALKRLWKKIIK
jgi:lipopolysaccharide cholinephosphotransferase